MYGYKVCPKCGTNNINQAAFCNNCGLSLKNTVDQNKIVENRKAGNKWGITALLLLFLGTPFFYFSFYYLGSISNILFIRQIGAFLAYLCPITALAVMLVGNIRYPSNKFLNIIMCVIFGVILLFIILFIIYFIINLYYEIKTTDFY